MRAPLLYYITDSRQFPGNEAAQRDQLLGKIAEAARCGIDFIQLREKDLSTRELECLADDAVQLVRQASSSTRLLINSRTDVAIAIGADGVHLRSDDVRAEVARRILPPPATIAVSCHTVDEVAAAAGHADFVVFGPVFGKQDSSGSAVGLDNLRAACNLSIPVLALGGVTLENARDCLDAGAAGIAAIRLFQQNEIGDLVVKLRSNRSDKTDVLA